MTDVSPPGRTGLAWLRADLDQSDDGPPVALWGEVDGQAARRALLRRLAARALGCSQDAVVIAHAEGRPPRIVSPPGSGLTLSSASRDGVAVAAVGAGLVGVDVERVDESEDPPWRVLHPDEACALTALGGHERAAAFAAIWAAKEAYLKARGVGLGRDTRDVRVSLGDEGARIEEVGREPARARLAWLRRGGGLFAVGLVAFAQA